MPYTAYALVTDDDVKALYAYFINGVTPVDVSPRETKLPFPFNIRLSMAAWNLLFLDEHPFETDGGKSAEWNRGAYLVRGLAHCGACHTARNALGGSSDLTDLSGGLIPMQNWYAPSLASATEAGTADWPLADIQQLLATGIAPRSTTAGPMAEVVLNSLQYLEPGDIRAMAVYL